MRIFLTGGTGFIGKFLIPKLDNGQNQLLILSRDKTTSNSKNQSFITGNLSNIKNWRDDVSNFKPDATIHLAWEGIPDYGSEISQRNLKYSLELIKFLTEINCKTILATGSVWEYGNKNGKLSESLSPKPFNPFTKAKTAIYLEGMKLTNKRKVNFIWARIFYVYGPGQKESSLIPYLISCAKENKIPEMRNPNAQNDFVYVEDVAEAIKQILNKYKKSGILNIGSGKLTSVQQIIKTIFKYYKVKYQLKKTTLLGIDNVDSCWASIEKIKDEVGWKPKVTIDEGIKKVIKSTI